MHLDALLATGMQTALLSGGFALAGVLLATGVGLLTAHLQRKWQTQDRQDRERHDAQILLRNNRLETYSTFLERFGAWETAILDIHEGWHFPPTGERGEGTLRERYSAMWFEHGQPSESAFRRARLLADPDLEALLVTYDKQLEDLAALVLEGAVLQESNLFAYRTTRDQIYQAMQAEIRVDKTVATTR